MKKYFLLPICKYWKERRIETEKSELQWKKTEGLGDKYFLNFGGLRHSDVKISSKQKT